LRVADFNRRLRFSLTLEHVLSSMLTPNPSRANTACHEYTVNMRDVVVALDSGTTSTRAMVFDHDGRVVASEHIAHEQYFPRPGWVEHDATELVANASRMLADVMDKAGLTADRVVALGITNQRETTVVWNRTTGQPIGRALVWQDTRTQPRVDAVREHGNADFVTAVTGLPVATYFSATKIAEILDTHSGARDAARRGELIAGTIDSWLLWNLTGGVDGGVHLTDVTNASRTMLMDIESLAWREELCDLFDVPHGMLPSIVPSAFNFGAVQTIPALSGVTIAAMVGDQQAATLGHVAVEAGEAKNTYGTGNFLIVSTGHELVRSQHGLLTTVGFQRDGEPVRYALEGSVAVSGSLIQWLRDNLGIISSSDDIEPLAASVPDNGGVVIVPAFSGLFAPHWRPDARGVIAGITRFTTKAHLARAALESVACQSHDVIAAAQKDLGKPIRELNVDGGMVRNDLLMQFQSDISGLPVVRPAISETTALGAAFAAGLAVGFWRDENELRTRVDDGRRFEPAFDAETRTQFLTKWNKGIQRSLDWV
jgi:glycerol kinase